MSLPLSTLSLCETHAGIQRNMNVLIVDDEPLARERLSRMVGELEGYSVLEPSATNGEEALALIDSHKPDIVLLDIRMPGLDGLQVAAKLCERESPPPWCFAPPGTTFRPRCCRPVPWAIWSNRWHPRRCSTPCARPSGPTACNWRR
ncbi:protein of unknown function [Pseudomonas mediterranea]